MEVLMFYKGKHWISEESIEIKVENGTISSIQKTEEECKHWIAPGLIDIQVNGIGGYDLNGFETTEETVLNVVKELHKVGVTQFCPTVVTGTRERMLHCIKVISKAYETYPLVKKSVIGIHVEGPYISEEDGPRGAHNKEWVRDPDIEELNDWLTISNNLICKVTLAPEKTGSIEFIKALYELGIVAAIGHCNATEDDIQKAVEAGATMSTHLGNGAHPSIKRHPNYIWSQLAEDNLWAGIIADGHHLPKSVLKVMIRTKGKKAIITSDAVSLAGMPPGNYKTNINRDVVLQENGLLHLANTPDILAGSAVPLNRGVENLVKMGICDLKNAILMASHHPAQLFGLDKDGTGSLRVNSPANFIIFSNENNNFKIVKTISNGEIVYEINKSKGGSYGAS